MKRKWDVCSMQSPTQIALFCSFFVGGYLFHHLYNQQKQLVDHLLELYTSQNMEYIEDSGYSPFGMPSCVGLVPTYNASFAIPDGPIGSLEDLGAPGQRAMLVAARFGIGNSLRGYCSSFVYSVLSGRRLVLLHAGAHARVLDLLCTGFDCAFDSIRGTDHDSQSNIWRNLAKYKAMEVTGRTPDLQLTLFNETPIALSQSPSYYDDYWFRNATLKRCVYEMFACASKWCVQSRAIHALVRGPSRALSAVVRDTVTSSKPSLWRKAQVPSKFDFAIHVRTRSPTVEDPEYFKLNLAACNSTLCEEKAKKVRDAVARYSADTLWTCIGEEISRGSGERNGSLAIFLATDFRPLQAFFVEKLKPYGIVYYSTSDVIHSSKSDRPVAEALPTLAELHLMSRAATVIEAETYISTFAYFAGLIGNSTIAAVKMNGSECGFLYENPKN